MSEERDFVPGEIAILKLELPPTPESALKGFEPLPIGTELLIKSHRYQTPGRDGVPFDGYKFKVPKYPGYTCSVNHFRLTRRREPPQELSKHSFQEIMNNLKDEQPLKIEEEA